MVDPEWRIKQLQQRPNSNISWSSNICCIEEDRYESIRFAKKAQIHAGTHNFPTLATTIFYNMHQEKTSGR